MNNFVLDTLYVPAESIDHALLEFESGNWYASPTAAWSVADQHNVEQNAHYGVFSVTFKEMK